MKLKVILKCPKCLHHKNISHYSGEQYGTVEKCEKCGEPIKIYAENWSVLRE